MSDGINTQEYLNNVLSGSSIAEAANENVDQFFNRRNPNLAIQHEKPEHRLALMLKSRGMNNRDIGKALNFTDSWVSQLMRQPWAQERLLQLMSSEGVDSIKGLIECEAANNIFTILEVRDSVTAKPEVRLAAANSLLDRFLGKPTQHIESDTTVHHAADIASVDRELQELQREEQRLCGAAANVDMTSIEQR